MQKHPLQPYWTEKAKAAMKEKREAGAHLGKAPIGYKNVRINGEPAIVIDAGKATGVKALFKAVAEGRSVRKAGRLAWEHGLRTKGEKELGPSSLYAVLTNPFYQGMIQTKNETISGKHGRIVSAALFEKAQRQLSGAR